MFHASPRVESPQCSKSTKSRQRARQSMQFAASHTPIAVGRSPHVNVTTIAQHHLQCAIETYPSYHGIHAFAQRAMEDTTLRANCLLQHAAAVLDHMNTERASIEHAKATALRASAENACRQLIDAFDRLHVSSSSALDRRANELRSDLLSSTRQGRADGDGFEPSANASIENALVVAETASSVGCELQAMAADEALCTQADRPLANELHALALDVRMLANKLQPSVDCPKHYRSATTSTTALVLSGSSGRANAPAPGAVSSMNNASHLETVLHTHKLREGSIRLTFGARYSYAP